MKLIELVFDPTATDRHYYGGPNGWKTRLSLLHMGIDVETEEASVCDLRYKLSEIHGKRITSPAIELEDGSLLCGSFDIAEYLEDKFPDRLSLFTGSLSKSVDAVKAKHFKVGKTYARLIDAGLGASDPQWAIWFDLVFPDIDKRVAQGEIREYFISDARLGPGGYEKMCKRGAQEDLVARAKLNVLPLIQVLKQNQGQFLQGEEPGFVDYVVFGRYAMCRNNNPKLAKEVWEDQGEEIQGWVERIVQRYPSIQKNLRAYE
ncbi:hypothetical protein HK100_009059 [Physocladia obscura]|uniref:GST N-terminal domain-containing protein n=1 Tax=Physocladia obscura TaxID=109957 RepID=A0AAD5SMX9_9FUNG|nr:hypothetical protein HK100_009059 [Physocladia obscura]